MNSTAEGPVAEGLIVRPHCKLVRFCLVDPLYFITGIQFINVSQVFMSCCKMDVCLAFAAAASPTSKKEHNTQEGPVATRIIKMSVLANR